MHRIRAWLDTAGATNAVALPAVTVALATSTASRFFRATAVATGT